MEKFIENPSLSSLSLLGRKDLFGVCRQLAIKYSANLSSQVLRDKITLHYIGEDVFDESLLDSVSYCADLSEEDIKKDILKRQAILAEEEAKSKAILAERQADLAEKETLARIALEREIQLKKLEMSSNINSANVSPVVDRVDISQMSIGSIVVKYAKLLPKFNESDLITFFNSFEETARHCDWPDKCLTALLNTVLVGKGASTYNSLTLEDRRNYSLVKSKILMAYQLTPEGYRQNFRKLRKIPTKSHVEFL